MKFYLHKKAYDVPLYRGKLIVVLSNDVNRIEKLLPEFEFNKIYGCACFGDYNGSYGYYMILNLHDKLPMTPGVVAHEAVHLSNMIAREVGLKPDVNNDEAFAYLVEWITNKGFEFIKEKKFNITI